MALIRLTMGKFAIVDDDDVVMLSQHKWYAKKGLHTFYAATSINRKAVQMHRLITGFKWPIVDHINRDGLDNRKENLREATPSQNICNSQKSKNCLRPYKGVVYDKAKDRFRSEIGCFKNGTLRRGKRRHTAEEAARDYDVMAREAYGEFAYQNFPQAGQIAGLACPSKSGEKA